MKKLFQWALAAALIICAASVFTACSSNDDNPATPDLGVKEKIIGKWMFYDRNGELTPTNKKRVFNFVSTTKAYVSASHTDEYAEGAQWIDHTEGTVVIDGNKVTLTMQTDEHTTMVDEFDITAISGSEFTARLKVTIMVDGSVVRSSENTIRLTKLTADYSEAVIGLWECQGITGGETNNDDNARLEFLANGTYNFYRKSDAGVWSLVPRERNEYFVDGNLLCTRWQAEGEQMSYEWWEINSAADGQMQWTALRQQADGTTFQQGVTWKATEARTVLAGMDATGIYYYGDATYTYTYDDDLRLTHVYEVVPSSDNLVVRDLTITYSAGRVVMSGFIEGTDETDVCTLDAQGRIVEVVSTYSRPTDDGGTKTGASNFTFTYDDDGHLLTQTRDGSSTTFHWQNGDIVRIVVGSEGNGYTVEMTPSDAPAQGCFNLFGYDLDLSLLCPQGLFGVLPLHMPASRVITVYIGGNPIHSSTTNHTYTVTDGRLVTIDDNYTFHWGMR